MADRIIGRLAYKIVGDDKQFQKALKKSTRDLDKAADRFQQIGTRLSLGVTAPILAVGGAMVKAATDAEVTENKFRVAFDGIDEAANEAVGNLTENYGLATDQAQKLLAGTGDLLKGFGATADQALGLSSEVQSLAADLASYSGIAGGTEQASKAVTAALLGEREQIKQLGVVIRQADVDQKLMEKGQADLTGQAKLLAQAQATLELIVEQSSDAIGSYERNGASAAQQQQELINQVRDLAVELGTELLPMFKAITEEALSLIESFRDLTDAQKTAIIQIAAFAAAMGPLSIAIGTAIKVVNALKLAAVALGGASGLGLVVLAAGAVVTAVRVIRGPIREARESLDELAGTSEDTAKELDEVARALSESEQFSENFEDVERNVRQIADASGRTVDEVIEIGLATSRLGDEYQDQLEKLKEQRGVTEEIVEENEDAIEPATRRSGIESDVADYIREQYELKVRMRALDNQELDLKQQLSTIDELIAAGVFTEEEGLERKIELREKEIDKLRDINGYETMSESQRRAALESIGEDVQAQKAMIQAYQDRIEALRSITGEQDDQVDYSKRQLNLLEETERRTTAIKDETAEIPDIWKQLQRDAGDFGDLQLQIIGALKQGWGDTFEIFGEGIIAQELSLESLGEAYKNMFVTILRALGDEFLARAVAATAMAFIPGLQSAGAGAGGLYAASALAYTAAGAVSAFANGGSFVADQPTLALFGENGPETVDIQPVPKVGPPGATQSGQTIVVNGDVYGYDDLARAVDTANRRASRTGRIR